MNSLVHLLQQRAAPLSDTESKAVFSFLDHGETIGNELTYHELDRSARIIAGHLQRYCAPGDRALLLLSPGLDYISAFFGCLYAGVIAVPAMVPNPGSLARIRAIAADAQPRLALVPGPSESASSEAHDWFDHAALGQMDCVSITSLTKVDVGWVKPMVRSTDIAFLQYTSGSTGSAKGVKVSHANLIANACLAKEVYGLDADEVLLSWLPPHHDFGLVGGIVLPVVLGCRCIQFAPSAFMMRPHRWLKAMSDYRVTMTGAPNFAYALAAQKITDEQKKSLDLRYLRLAVNGAERIRCGTLRAFAEAFAGCGFRAGAFTPAYGLAESTLLVSADVDPVRQALPPSLFASKSELAKGIVRVCPDGDDSVELVPVGRTSATSHEIAIVDPANGTRVPDLQVGEIWVRGESVSTGYWSAVEGANSNFGAGLLGEQKAYLRTGDLGFVRDRTLYVVGRIKEVMIFGGRNIYPQDVEASVEQSAPAFRANGCAAFSIDSEDGEQLVLVQEIEARKQMETAGLAERIQRVLLEQHEISNLRAICLVRAGHLPRTSSGKIRRLECRNLFLSGGLASVWSWERNAQAGRRSAYRAPVSETEKILAEIVSEVLQVEGIGVDDDIFRLGVHSLAATQIVARIHLQFPDLSSMLTLRSIFETSTISSLAEKIDSLIASTESFEI